MIISEKWGMKDYPTHNIICETKEEKKALLLYLNEKYEKYDIETEKVEFEVPINEELSQKIEGYYFKIMGPKKLNSEKIIEWYNKNVTTICKPVKEEKNGLQKIN